MNLRQAIRGEFERRRAHNSSYSLRAFARFLGTDHSSLSQILRGRRNLSTEMARRFGRRLKIDPYKIRDACLDLHADTIVRLMNLQGFKTDSRWIAIQSGIPVDHVNVALHRLLHKGSLSMSSISHWQKTRKPYAQSCRPLPTHLT